jgi:ribonuclease BN (tRNA processing enzyme)
MKLIVLGSGTTVPHLKRSSAAYWLETAESRILLDCSATATARMLAEGLPWHELDAIWISHFHIDHCGGLTPFLGGIRHSAEMKERTKVLNIFGPKGLRHLIKKFSDVYDYKLFDQPFPLEIIEVEPLEEFEMAKDVSAVSMKTPHTDESLAIHLRDSRGTTIVYTADTGFTETLTTFARGVDLLLIEASFPSNKPVQKHLELAEAMFIIRKAQPKQAVLTHLYAEWDNVDLDKALAEFSPLCDVIKAEDGLRIEFGK